MWHTHIIRNLLEYTCAKTYQYRSRFDKVIRNIAYRGTSLAAIGRQAELCEAGLTSGEASRSVAEVTHWHVEASLTAHASCVLAQ